MTDLHYLLLQRSFCLMTAIRLSNLIMSTFKRTKKKDSLRGVRYCVMSLLSLILILWLYGWFVIDNDDASLKDTTTIIRHRDDNNKCPIASIAHLSEAELHPVAGDRHMITPPQGGKLVLVCCDTTQGNMNVLLHENWAPLGVARFLEMVKSHYFETKIPLFRCTDACQFGLAGDPAFTERFNTRIQDDPMWLPPGPDFRQNEQGVRRYPQGYFTYAGGGKNSRTNQFVLTLKPNQFMGGGSPWEVPMGELVGKESFETMSKFYTGYGEKGPPQVLLHREGNSEKVRTEWPLLDYITGCNVVDEMMLPD